MEGDSSLSQLKDSWSKEEDAMLEGMLGNFSKVDMSLFEWIASYLRCKNAEQVRKRYDDLVADVEAIESGLHPLPEYRDGIVEKGPKKKRDAECRWTQAEHKLFLEGLKNAGEGDWRAISRHYVIIKTPVQVASHAQKYYMRQSGQGSTKKRRKSIHDICLKDGLRTQPEQQSAEAAGSQQFNYDLQQQVNCDLQQQEQRRQ